MRRKMGFTLIELVITIALIGMVVTVGTNMLIFAMRSQEMVVDEFDMQSNVRIVAKKVNTAVRNSSGVFLLAKDYPDGSVALEDYLTEGWDYMMLNEDKTELVEWKWNGTAHVENIIVSAVDGVVLDLAFDKENASDVDRLLQYSLTVTSGGRTRVIESELESVNSLQVMDRSYGNPANAIAYRNDSRLSEVAVAQAAVSFVIDKSGSMAWGLGGQHSYVNDTNTSESDDSRLKILKREATKMVDGLAENDNIYLSVSPFSYTANSITTSNLNKMLHLKSNKSAFVGTTGVISTLTANGATNTGDGMRRGFKTLENFNSATENQDKITKNFMIILVDGETNTESVYENMTSHNITSYVNPFPHTFVNGSNIYTFDYTDDYNNRFYYLKDGVSSYLSDNPAGHTYENNGRTYAYYNWYDYIGRDNEYYYNYTGPLGPVYVLSDQNITDSEAYNNTYYTDGRYKDTNNSNYVTTIGGLVKNYRNTREDGIRTFVIGFTSSVSPSGLQAIATATGATDGTNGTTYKYYVADTASALNAVLSEIKFQISDALWHIGGPN